MNDPGHCSIKFERGLALTNPKTWRDENYSPPNGQSCLPVAAALFLTGSFCLAQENNAQVQNTNSNQDNQVSALKTQMQKMQKDYEDRI